MPASEALERAIKKYEAEKIDKILLRVPKGFRDEIKNHSLNMGESVNAFIMRAIEETMKRDKKKSRQ